MFINIWSKERLVTLSNYMNSRWKFITEIILIEFSLASESSWITKMMTHLKIYIWLLEFLHLWGWQTKNLLPSKFPKIYTCMMTPHICYIFYVCWLPFGCSPTNSLETKPKPHQTILLLTYLETKPTPPACLSTQTN